MGCILSAVGHSVGKREPMQRTAMIALLIGLAGCATHPQTARNQAYDGYWQCASQAIRPYVQNNDLSAREAAMRAQARCNRAYGVYRDAQVSYVGSKVTADNNQLADQLGRQAALVRRQAVTRSLTDYVTTQRARR